jgi:hypothetical protein
VPQVKVLPHPSESVPHVFPAAAQVVGVHPVQTPLVQTSLVWQVPQLKVFPHPSESEPQVLPAAAQVVGTQATQ